MKRAHNLKDGYFEEQCKVNSKVLLPTDNSMNMTLAMMKKLLRCRQVQDIEEHVCVNDCCKFPKLEPSEYSARSVSSLS